MTEPALTYLRFTCTCDNQWIGYLVYQTKCSYRYQARSYRVKTKNERPPNKSKGRCRYHMEIRDDKKYASQAQTTDKHRLFWSTADDPSFGGSIALLVLFNGALASSGSHRVRADTD